MEQTTMTITCDGDLRFAQDVDRGIRIELLRTEGSYLFKGRPDIWKVYFWYRSPEANFTCHYFNIHKNVPYTFNNHALEAELTKAAVIPKAELVRNFGQSIKESRNSLPSFQEIDRVCADIADAIIARERARTAELSTLIAVPDPKAAFVEHNESEARIAQLLDTLVAGEG